MIIVEGHNITSPLGMTTHENLVAVRRGLSSLKTYPHHWGLPEDITASLFSDEQWKTIAAEVDASADGKAVQSDATPFEQLVTASARRALEGCRFAVDGRDVVLIISTTKANVGLLTTATTTDNRLYPGTAAQRIAVALGVKTTPVVVDNACISGLSALILAERLLKNGSYRHAIVCGADVQNKFIVSGFQSFKALSPKPCRPFDLERLGLNLGEAAATMVLSQGQSGEGQTVWTLENGAVRNDAYHISAPSRQGEGAYRAMMTILENKDKDTLHHLALVSAHGTATMFNDQMESKAIERAATALGLTDEKGFCRIPVNGYKGYYGHTMGAAGILETILTMAALDEGVILATKGFEERGVSGKIRVTTQEEPAEGHAFVKMLSGFGGCNAALLVSKSSADTAESDSPVHPAAFVTRSTLRLTPADGALTDLYKKYIGDYPKYYKMDLLSKLGFVASELLLKQVGEERPAESREDRAVILFNRSASIHADRRYVATISDKENYYPSPALFVYTLPNIVTGEIAIRNHYHGETSFYILPEKDEALMEQILRAALLDGKTHSILTGWLDAEDEAHYEADLRIVGI
ncbi:MAG: beta-ketoacyl synthase N-terminal-like domain-containing protein [Prevotellaceae bacterium]|nr:beta-ketoacyl synthase N-terminal-like domain-containing protein [Prevotellaceae bacterium]